MAKSDKTDKPGDVQSDSKPEAEGVIDAEIVEEETGSDESEDVVQEDVSDDIEDAVELEDPEAVSEEAVEATEEEELAEPHAEEAEVELPDEPQKPEIAEAPPEAKEQPRSGMFPMVMGGIVAGAVGFGAATYLGSQGILFGAQSSDELAELSRKLEDQNDLIKLLQSNQDKTAEIANQANEGRATAEEANARVAALSERIDTLGTKTQALEGRVIEAEKRPMTEGASSAAIEAYEREVEQLRAMVAEQLAEAETLKETSARTAQETMAQAALTRIVSAVDTGVPYRNALTELASVSGVAIPAELSEHANKGVPTNLALADAFPEYARAALAEARKLEADGGNRISHFLKTQLGARSTEPKEGTDADSILSRAEAALREGRLAASLEELTALPESSQSVLSEWRAMAEIRLAATQAVTELAQSLNSN